MRTPAVFQRLPSLLPTAILRGTHALAGLGLRRAGYRFELRRSGELKLGVWRKTLRPTTQARKHLEPRRFVVLPGWADSPLSWIGVLALIYPTLKKEFDEVVLVDFPGFHGFLSHEKCIAEMGLLIRATHDLLHSLQPHTILGHSLGGWLAAHYAGTVGRAAKSPKEGQLKRREKGPETLLLVNPSGAFGSEKKRLEWESFVQGLFKTGFSAYRGELFSKEPIWFKWVAPLFADFFERDDVRQFLESFREDHLPEPLLESVDARVYLLWGEDDRLIPPGFAQAWLELLEARPGKKAFFRSIQGTGHMPQIEKPWALSREIRKALRAENHAPAPARPKVDE